VIIYKKDNVVIRTPMESDVQYLKNNLRESDIEEIRASNDHTPEVALRHGLRKSSFCATALFNGKPVCMFGMVPDAGLRSAATAWMLGTDDIEVMWLTFAKLSKKMIGVMLENIELLYNCVDAKNEKTIRWLKWCGAKIDEPTLYGVRQLPFRFFSITRS
jgi:hypothetical protein